MLTKDQLDKLRSITNNILKKQTNTSSNDKEDNKKILSIDKAVLDKLDLKWKNLVEKYKDELQVPVSDVQYDEFGAIMFDANEEGTKELPKISDFGITE